MEETILDRWEISAEQLTRMLDENPSLKGMIFGYIAEVKVRELVESNPSITRVTKDDDHDRSKKGDLRFQYRGREFVMETKSLQTNKIKRAPPGADGIERLSGKARDYTLDAR